MRAACIGVGNVGRRTDYPPDARTVALAHDALAHRIPVDTIARRRAWRNRRLIAMRHHLMQADQDEDMIDAL